MYNRRDSGLKGYVALSVVWPILTHHHDVDISYTCWKLLTNHNRLELLTNQSRLHQEGVLKRQELKPSVRDRG